LKIWLKRKWLAIGLGTSVLKLIQANYIDWMHACGGKGRCTTCKFEVVEGGDQLGPITGAELGYRNKGELGEKERLACQAISIGRM
jgi:2Fe-2S ferredoxin